MTKVKEIWLPSILSDIEVSNYGRLRKVEYVINEKYIAEKVDGIYRRKLVSTKKRVFNYKYSTPRNHKGYLTFKGKLVHRLVAIAHIPNPNNFPEVNHIEGDKLDNRAWMLEWCTSQYNTYHSIYDLGYTTNFGKKKVRVIKDGNVVAELPTLREAAKFVDGKSTHISQVCKGQRTHHKGYQFEYLD